MGYSYTGAQRSPGQPHLTSPHFTSPHLTSPHLTSPHLTSPHLTSPHLTSPHLTSPHLTSKSPPPPLSLSDGSGAQRGKRGFAVFKAALRGAVGSRSVPATQTHGVLLRGHQSPNIEQRPWGPPDAPRFGTTLMGPGLHGN